MLVPTIRDGDWVSVRKAIQKLAGPKLGMTAIPVFAGIELSNGATIGIPSSSAHLKIGPSGQVGIQLPAGVEPSESLTIGSTTGTEELTMYHTGSNAAIRTTKGNIQFRTKNTTDRNTYFAIYGNSTPGIGYFRLYDQDEAEYIETRCSAGHGYIKTVGASPGPIHLQDSAHSSVRLFANAVEGETQEFKIYGFGTGSGGQESLDISVEQYAANTAEFYGLDSYLFDGIVKATGATITGCSVLGLNSAVFQPTTDSTTFFQVLDADGGTPILNVDTTNERVGIGTTTPNLPLHVESALNNVAKFVSTDNRASIQVSDNDTNTYLGAEAGISWIGHGPAKAATNLNILVNGNVGIGETVPETLTEWTHVQPYLTLHNSTHEDIDGGRESRLIFKGEQSGGEETTLARIQVSHDGSSDDQLGKMVLSVNTGAGIAQALEIGSDLLATFAGAVTVNGTIRGLNSLFLGEQASALADVEGKGQLWVKIATPNTLWFTDDAGTDIRCAPQDLQTSASPTWAGATITGTGTFGNLVVDTDSSISSSKSIDVDADLTGIGIHRGINVAIDTEDADKTASIDVRGFDTLIYEKSEFNNQFLKNSIAYGMKLVVQSNNLFEGTTRSSSKKIYGVYGQASTLYQQDTADGTNEVDIYGGWFSAKSMTGLNNADGTTNKDTYGFYVTLADYGLEAAGTLNKNLYGAYFDLGYIATVTNGDINVYGLYIKKSHDGDNNWGIYDSTGWDTYIAGNIGIGETIPETLTEWTSIVPYLTLHNSTHEDIDGGRESRLIFKGEQSGGEETSLAMLEVSHDGAVDDQLGKIIASVNTGAGLAEGLRINSNADVDIVNDLTAGTIQADNGFTGTWLNNEGNTVIVAGGVIIGVQAGP